MARKHPGFTPKQPHKHESLRFPKGFIWGAATSSHQVEGWNDNNDWWAWEHQPGTIADGQMSGRGPNHWNLFKDDYQLIQDMHLNAYRLSIEWSRIMPLPGVFDDKAIDHYIQMLQDLKSRNVQVMLTLHHFTVPNWFAKLGGFEKQKNLHYFIEYVEKVVPLFKSYVDFWITINEPNIYSMMSYIIGVWPPGKTSTLTARKVFHHLAQIHKDCYDIIHTHCGKKAKVGFANNVTSFYLYNKRSIKDWFVGNVSDWIWNHWFMEKTKGHNDFLGMNYYVHKRIKNISRKNLQKIMIDNQGEGRERTDLDWEIFAPGIFDALVDMSAYNLPIYITENGISTLNDHQRARYIVSYLKEVFHAIKAGVDVKGYFYWSLLDNFEWDKGYKSRFGLVDVDYQSLKRTLRGSGKLYGRIAETNMIEHGMLRFVGHAISPEEVVKLLKSEELKKEGNTHHHSH